MRDLVALRLCYVPLIFGIFHYWVLSFNCRLVARIIPGSLAFQDHAMGPLCSKCQCSVLEALAVEVEATWTPSVVK